MSTLHLNLHPSRYLLAFILLTHFGALALLLTLPLLLWVKGVIALCVVASFIQGVSRHVLRRHKKTILKVWVDEQGQWHLLQRDGQTFAVKLRGDSLCSGLVVILNFNPKRTVLVFPDSVTATEFRRLKAWLNSH